MDFSFHLATFFGLGYNTHQDRVNLVHVLEGLMTEETRAEAVENFHRLIDDHPDSASWDFLKQALVQALQSDQFRGQLEDVLPHFRGNLQRAEHVEVENLSSTRTLNTFSSGGQAVGDITPVVEVMMPNSPDRSNQLSSLGSRAPSEGVAAGTQTSGPTASTGDETAESGPSSHT